MLLDVSSQASIFVQVPIGQRIDERLRRVTSNDDNGHCTIMVCPAFDMWSMSFKLYFSHLNDNSIASLVLAVKQDQQKLSHISSTKPQASAALHRCKAQSQSDLGHNSNMRAMLRIKTWLTVPFLTACGNHVHWTNPCYRRRG